MKQLTLITGIVVLLALGLSQPQRSVEAFPKDVWLKVQSKHFTLIGNADEKQIRKVGAELEQFREAVTRLSGLWQRRFSPPITVYVFKDDETYQPYKLLYQGKTSDVSGYLQSSNDSAHITLTTDAKRQSPEAVIFHEYVHYLTSGGKWSLPVWLNEGLAEYFSTFIITGGGKQIVIGQPIPSHLQKLRASDWLSLRTLLAVDNESTFYQEADKKTVFYAQSWVLTHWLLTGDAERLARFQQMLAAMSAGLSAEIAFKQFFQADLANLESLLREYVRKNVLNSQTISFDRKIEVDETMSVGELGDAELKAYLGDLLWHIERTDDGEFALDRALAIDAKQSLALSSLGLLRLKQARFAEARQLLQRAIETGSANYLTYYSHAFAWQQQQVDATGYISEFDPGAVKGMRASLNRARELMPDFADTYKTLAFINLVQKENLDEAVTLLQKAIALEPRREDFQYTLAQVYLRQKEFLLARRTAETILKTGENPDIRQKTEFLLQTITQRESETAMEKLVTEIRLKRERESPAKPEDDPTKPPGKRFEGEQVQGTLTRMDCTTQEVTLTVVSGGRTFRFRANWGAVTLVRHTMDIPNQITCGALTPAPQVIVTYRPVSGGKLKFDGEPVGVEFLKPGATIPN